MLKVCLGVELEKHNVSDENTCFSCLQWELQNVILCHLKYIHSEYNMIHTVGMKYTNVTYQSFADLYNANILFWWLSWRPKACKPDFRCKDFSWYLSWVKLKPFTAFQTSGQLTRPVCWNKSPSVLYPISLYLVSRSVWTPPITPSSCLGAVNYLITPVFLQLSQVLYHISYPLHLWQPKP